MRLKTKTRLPRTSSMIFKPINNSPIVATDSEFAKLWRDKLIEFIKKNPQYSGNAEIILNALEALEKQSLNNTDPTNLMEPYINLSLSLTKDNLPKNDDKVSSFIKSMSQGIKQQIQKFPVELQEKFVNKAFPISLEPVETEQSIFKPPT